MSPWKLSQTREDVMLLTWFIWRIFGFGKTIEKNQLTSGNVLHLMDSWVKCYFKLLNDANLSVDRAISGDLW